MLGTLLAYGLVRARTRWSDAANIMMLIPLVTPEIVAGASALLLFTQVGLNLSITTIILAHITFSISYVAVVVRARSLRSAARSRMRRWIWAPPAGRPSGS